MRDRSAALPQIFRDVGPDARNLTVGTDPQLVEIVRNIDAGATGNRQLAIYLQRAVKAKPELVQDKLLRPAKRRAKSRPKAVGKARFEIRPILRVVQRQ